MPATEATEELRTKMDWSCAHRAVGRPGDDSSRSRRQVGPTSVSSPFFNRPITPITPLRVADAFEAMTAVRPYRLRPMSAAQAMEELRKYSGIQFDPQVVDAFGKTASAQGETALEPVMEAPIPMLGQVAALRAKGTISAAVPFKE